MRICLWSSASFENWYSSYHLIQRIIHEMIDAGHEVWLLQQQYSTGMIPKDLVELDRLHVINVKVQNTEKGNFIRRYVSSIYYYLKSSKLIPRVDVIFLQSNNTAIIPIRAAKKRKIPILYNVQDIFPIDALVVGKLHSFNPTFIITRWYQAKAYQEADRVVTISDDLKKTIQEEGREDIDVIYNWSFQDEPYNIPDERNHFLLSNNIKRDDGFRVVYAGNVGQMMESEMIVQAAKKLSEYTDIKFYIIGEGSGLKRFKSRVKEEELNNILFYPRQPMEYAQENYCAADVNINPVPKGVIYTCMPSKTATCLLSERPTIVSMDLDSDMAKRLSRVDQWTVVAPGDTQAMVDAILQVYKNENQHSKNAAEFLAKFGPVENAKQYVRILEEVSETNAKA